MTHHYRYAGLRIDSDLALPEWAAFTCTGGEAADIRFVLTPAAPSEQHGAAHLSPTHWRLQVPEIARFDVEHGDRVTITPVGDAEMPELRLFLLGSVWAALCYQRGMLPLHASVIAVDGRAIAFCGASGAGKSSTAAWLVERGFPLVSDDLCVCRLGDVPAIWPSMTRLKLWSTALDALAWDRSDMQRDFFRVDKFYRTLPAPYDATTEPLLLHAVYLLDWGEPVVERLRGNDAVQTLVRAISYRGDLLAGPAQVAAHWGNFIRLAGRVPVYRLSRPKDWDRLDDAMRDVVAGWQAG